jgi:hypothetical protein
MVKTAKTHEPDKKTADVIREGLEEAVQVIRDDIHEARMSAQGTPERAAVPRMAAQLVAIGCEIRKAAKAELNSLRDITPAAMLQWVRLQTPEVRARLVKDITAIDAPARRSVLG